MNAAMMAERANAGRERGGSRRARKSVTRARLLETAEHLFSERGFAATRTEDIAAGAGVSHGTVFLHFPTREALVTDVILGYGRRVTGEMRQRQLSGMGLREALSAHLEGIREHEDLYRHLLAEAPVLPPAARDTLLGIQSAVSGLLAAAAEREQAAGTLREMPTHLLFNTWIGLLHHYLVNRELFAPGGSVIERYGEELLEHYVNLLSCERGD